MDEEGRLDEVAVEEAEVEAGGSAEPEASLPVSRRRPRWRRVLRLARYSLAALLLVVGLFFIQTGRGQRIVLDELLDRLESTFAGQLTIEGVRSRTLLLGVTLRGVRLDAEGERRFLEADSVVIRYSPLSLAVGAPRLSSSTFYGLRVEISRHPDDDFMNVDRILRPSPAVDTVRGPPQIIGLGRIAVRGGTVEVLTPTTDAPEALTVPAPKGGRLRRIAFEDLDLDLERTVLRTEGPVMVDARLASFSTSAFLLQEPLVVRAAQGDLTFGDRGLRIQGAAFRLPGSFLEGDLAFGPERSDEPWRLGAQLNSDEWSDLSDIGWVDPRVPDGRFRGSVGLRLEDEIEIDLRAVDVQTGRSAVALEGETSFGDVMSMRGLRVTASPLELSVLEPWLGQELPFRGMLRGNATLGGTFADLSANGRVTFTPASLPDAGTTADFSGTFHVGEDPGGTSLDIRLDPFDYRVLEPVWPDARRLGSGRAILSVEGRADDGVLVVTDVTHRSDPTTTSRVVGRGFLRRDANRDWIIDARGELTPLSLPLLGRLWPQIDLPGAVRGPVRANGRVTDLRMEGDLTSDAGRLVFDVTTDMTAPGSGYVLVADAEELDVAAFTSAVPAPSVLTGRVSIQGHGVALDSLAGTADLALRSARVGGLAVDSSVATVRVRDGLLTADEVRANVAGILINGGGSMGLTERRNGQASFGFSAETLLGLRPIFMGDSILVADTLNPLELDVLRARGVDLDALPTAMDVRMEGGLEGTAEVRGWLGDLDLDLIFDLTEAAYGHNSVSSASVSLMASGLPETRGEWDVDLDARGIVWSEREFQEVRFDGAMIQRRGEGVLDVVRRPEEHYHLTGAFAVDSLGGELQLTDAVIEVDEMSWTLSHPTTVAWNETSLTVDSLEVTRSGADPMTLTAAGTLTRGGDSDFRMVTEGFHIEELLGIAQREDIDLTGHIDLVLDVAGPAERPVISSRFSVEGPRYGSFELSRIEGVVDYEERLANLELSAWDGQRRVLTGEGAIPVDLALTDVEERSVQEEMDLTLRADSLDASLALVYLDALEDVVGTVSAEMRVRGTTTNPEPSGSVTLADAAWTIDAIGVRHRGVSGELLLQPNGTVGIKLATVGASPAAGSSTISGIVQLDPLTDPALDLAINFDRFLAVDRRDIQARISGDLTLTGRYRLPVTQGTLRMEEATLFVEEFTRSAGVVDLRSPLLYAPEIGVDTTVFVSQPLIADLSNPFLDNLRVDVDLAVPRNLWLRSRDMNVELGGDLLVVYDRREGDLVLVGELQALRGSYVVLGRTFVVDGGTASFLGQPGVNPTLDIQALSRVRRRERDRLEVRATVGGTLVEPLVTLSSEEAGLSQADLISYLILGRPSGELGAEGIGQELGSVGLTYAAGEVVSQLGSALAQELPLVNTLDYLAFSQSAAALQRQEIVGPEAAAGNVLGGTQVELGKYLNDDVFVIFVLGGKQSEDESGASLQLRGLRMEVALSESAFLELFMEEQSLRTGAGLGVGQLDDENVVGVLIFGEWGYGSRQQD